MRVNAETKARTREALLEAAAQAFAERGYHSTPIDSVSERAGVAKGTIYNYFSSKEDVLRALMEQACQFAAQAAALTPESAPTAARLEAFVAANLEWAQRHEALALLFARELLTGDAQIKALIAEAAAPCVQKVASILQDAADRGELSAATPIAELAFTFISLANMLVLQSREGPLHWPPPAELPATAARVFLHGVGDCRP